MAAKKKAASPQMRMVRPTAKPVPMPTRKPNRAPGQITPVPMPTRVPNLSLPPDQRAKAKRMPAGPKKSGTSGPAMPSRTKRSPARRKMI
jgi:hypothetical protein